MHYCLESHQNLITFWRTSRAVAQLPNLSKLLQCKMEEMKGEVSESLGLKQHCASHDPNFCKSSMLKPVFMCWHRAGNIRIKAVRKGWLGMKVSLSNVVGGLVLSDPILYQVFHAAHSEIQIKPISNHGWLRVSYIPKSFSNGNLFLQNGLLRLGPEA